MLYNLPLEFTITHHAGAFGREDNSLDSIANSVNYGAQIVEFDVSFHADGECVIIHKENPAKNEGASFEQALEIVAAAENCKINLDLKSVRNLPEIDRLVKKHKMSDRVFYTGVDEKWVKIVSQNSGIPYFLNHNLEKNESADEITLVKLAEKIMSLGAIGLNSHFDNATKLVVDILHSHKLLVSFWTVNEPEDAEKILILGPDNITSRCPDMIESFIK